MTLRLLRSALFCPANNNKILFKTATLRPDALIYDLEDAVTSDVKVAARSNLVEFLARNIESEQRRPTITVRVNCPLTTEWGAQDLADVSNLCCIDAFVLPKVESVESIRMAMDIIQRSSGRMGRTVSIWAMIETAKGVLDVEGVCADNAVEGILLGSNDLTKDLRARKSTNYSPLLFSMSKCILAARAHKKFVLDGVHNDIKDNKGFLESCTMARDMGFDGKSLIHPLQLEPANDIFSPSVAEISHAKEVVSAWSSALSEGKTLAVVNGSLVEELHYQEAKDLLELASFIENN